MKYTYMLIYYFSRTMSLENEKLNNAPSSKLCDSEVFAKTAAARGLINT